MSAAAVPVEAIVICRPEQTRAAAVVLSCLPGGANVPLVVLPPAPCTQAEYRALFAAYRELADERDLTYGATLARWELRDGLSPKPPDPAEIDGRAQLLTPYRSWVGRARTFAELLRRLEPRRAFVLFAPDDDALRYIEPIASHRLSDGRIAIVPEMTELVYVLQAAEGGATAASLPNAQSYRYETLAALAETMWQLGRGRALDPSERRALLENDGPAYLAGLFHAFESDGALWPTLDTSVATALGSRCEPHRAQPSEAVLIELEDDPGDAASLLGVQYAARRGARLVLCAAPDAIAIERARAALQARRASPIEVTPEMSDDQRVAAIEAALSGGDGAELLGALEKAVSSALTDADVAAIADLPLTAVTTSTPYGFVAKNGVSWARKPIGHIVGDRSALLLLDAFPPPPDAIGFNLLFDPGFITTDETHDVLTELRGRISYSLLLNGVAGSSLALNFMPPRLPIELLFFNTHGAGNGIVLGDLPMPLSAYLLAQRFRLASRPIVFNNSCQSWVGVGREFVASGARGYVGTLWDVDAGVAATYAKGLLAGLVRDRLPVSAAMQRTSVAAVDARAYLFVGTARGTLGDPNDELAGTPARLLRTANFMLDTLVALLEDRAKSSAIESLRALAATLLGESERLLALVDAATPEPTSERFDAVMLQMRAYAALVASDRIPASAAHAFFERWRGAIDGIADAKLAATYRAALYHCASRIPAGSRAWSDTIGILNQSIAAARIAGIAAGPQLLELFDAYQAVGALDDARDALAAATTALAGDALLTGTTIVGRQAQLARSMGDDAASLRFASDGFARADAADDLDERAAFKMDEARAYRGLGDAPNALTAARAALAFARLAFDDDRELEAYLLLARLLVQSGGLAEAADKAKRGSAWAFECGRYFEAGSFVEVLGDVALASGDPLAAVRLWRDAASRYARVPSPGAEMRLLERVKDASVRIGTPEARLESLATELLVVNDFGPEIRAKVAQDFVAGVLEFDSRGKASDLTAIASLAERTVGERGTSASDELRFMATIVTGAVAPKPSPGP